MQYGLSKPAINSGPISLVVFVFFFPSLCFVLSSPLFRFVFVYKLFKYFVCSSFTFYFPCGVDLMRRAWQILINVTPLALRVSTLVCPHSLSNRIFYLPCKRIIRSLLFCVHRLFKIWKYDRFRCLNIWRMQNGVVFKRFMTVCRQRLVVIGQY